MLRRLAATIATMLPPSLRYWGRATFGTPKRYRNLLKAVHATRARSILEVGVYRGGRSLQMIETAALFRPTKDIRYYGFDLFEGLNDELLKSEFSKVPPTEREIQERLSASGASVRLFKGFSQDTLPAFVAEWKQLPEPIDVVFIDGGHAEETIASDWQNVRQLMGPTTQVIFDDYYREDYAAKLGRVGCQYLIDALDRTVYDVEILDPSDSFKKDWGTLTINLAKVTLKG